MYDWFIQMKTDDGFIILEMDATIHCTIEWDGCDHQIYVDGFDVPTSRYHPVTGKWERGHHPAHFSLDSDSLWQRHLFMAVKEDLERDEDFIDHVMQDFDVDKHDRRPKHRYSDLIFSN